MSKTTVHSVAGAFGRSASADASPPCCATSDGGCFLAAVVQVICLAGFARPEGRVEKGRLSDINQALQVCAPISLRVLQSSIWATFWPLVEAFCLQSLNGVQSEAATTACFCGTTTTAAGRAPTRLRRRAVAFAWENASLRISVSFCRRASSKRHQRAPRSSFLRTNPTGDGFTRAEANSCA